jgi:hypothetical protein
MTNNTKIPSNLCIFSLTFSGAFYPYGKFIFLHLLKMKILFLPISKKNKTFVSHDQQQKNNYF